MGHHGISDEVRRFLEIDADDEDDRNRAMGDPPSGTVVLILQTTTDGDYPTTPNVFYKCDVVQVGGNEREGDSFVTGTTGSTVYAANLGSVVPPPGTFVVGVFVPDRHCFIYDG